MIAACRRHGCRVLVAIAVLIAAGQSVSAQAPTLVRVIRDQSIVWNLTIPTPITTVNTGTVLEVISRVREFYVVRLPASGGRGAVSGRIAISQVEIIQGSPPPEATPPEMRPGFDPMTGEIRTSGARIEERGIGWFAFGGAGLSMWNASQTFSAVLGSARTPMFGVGGQVRLDGQLIIEATVERIARTGERVFVSDGEVFKLGIRDTVRIIPISVSALYRQPGRRVAYYGGGGVGQYFYKEDSDFADPAENISERFTSYHAIFGAEFDAFTSLLKTAIEVQFTSVPNALGTTGASASFGEHNLGGVQFRVKILAGR